MFIFKLLTTIRTPTSEHPQQMFTSSSKAQAMDLERQKNSKNATELATKLPFNDIESFVCEK